MDETTVLCDYVAPSHHYLESWGDVEAKRGNYSLIQPTIAPLFNTRQAEESLLRWAAAPNLDVNAEQPYYEYLKLHWLETMFPQQSAFTTFRAFWDSTLHDGILELPASYEAPVYQGDAVAVAGKITKPTNSEMEISFYETVNIGAGQYAGNPWLQEMPDPITRCVWGNYLQVPIEWDGVKSFKGYKGVGTKNNKGIAESLDATIGERTERLTAITQFGQMLGTVSLALGYGREKGSKSAVNVGNNVYPWLSVDPEDGNTPVFRQ